MPVISDPLLGVEVGRYRITRPIGQGGMGNVYEGVQAASGAAVAIKVLAERFARDPSLIDRFFAEARATSAIAHENIVKVHDLMVLPDGRPCIVMELLAGQTLRQIIDAGRLPIGGVLDATLGVLSALAAAHAAGIVHRDIKPDNIFITTKGRAKVLDFGIAKLTGANAVARTQTGVLLGTPEYMAPEQILDGVTDARSDLYSLGVVLFEALTGTRPFSDNSDFDVMRAHVERDAPAPRTRRPELPAALDDVVACALSKHPRDRFASATAMTNALLHIATEVSIEQWRPLVPGGRLMSPRPPSMPPTIASPERAARTLATVVDRPRKRVPVPPRRPWRWWIAGAVACAGGVVVATQLSREAPAEPPRARIAIIEEPPREVPWPAPPAVPIAATVPVSPTIPSASPPVPERATKRGPARRAVEPTRFDWRAFHPNAVALAHAIDPKAQWTELWIDGVLPDGSVDLSQGAGTSRFSFHTPFAPNRSCEVRVAVSRTEAHALTVAGPCRHTPIGAPSCTLRQVRDTARVLDPRLANAVVRVTFTEEGWRVFAPDGSFLAIDDHCMPGRTPASVGDAPPAARAVRTEATSTLTAAQAKDLDVLAFAADAQTLARVLEPDAVLTRLALHFDGATDERTGEYEYAAAALAKDRRCIIILVSGSEAKARLTKACTRGRAIALPRCTPARFRAKGPAADTQPLMRITFEWTGVWTMVIVRGGERPLEKTTFEDRC